MVKVLFDRQHDGQNEMALSFKMQGNGHFQLKDYRSAIFAYKAGLSCKPPDQELVAKLHNNISTGLFYLKYNSTVLLHCGHALAIKPNYEKVLKRKAMCRQKIQDDDAARCIHYVFRYFKPVCASRERIQSTEINTSQHKRKILIRTIRQRKYRLLFGNISLENLTPTCVELEDHRVSFINGRLIWPAEIEFPDFRKHFLIQQFDENESFQDVIADLLPVSVDCCKYLPEFFLQIYFLIDDMIYPVDMRTTLKEILSLKEYFISSYVVHFVTPNFTVLVNGGKKQFAFLEQCKLVNLN